MQLGGMMSSTTDTTTPRTTTSVTVADTPVMLRDAVSSTSWIERWEQLKTQEARRKQALIGRRRRGLVTKKTIKTYPVEDFAHLHLLQADDSIYKRPFGWDGAPIILASHKLLFFTTPKVFLYCIYRHECSFTSRSH